MKTKVYVTSEISHICYTCPHCKETISYDTDGLPAKEQCHKCLKKLTFEYIYS